MTLLQASVGSAARSRLSPPPDPMLQSHLLFSWPSHHNPPKSLKPWKLHAWVHCIPGSGMGKRITFINTGWPLPDPSGDAPEHMPWPDTQGSKGRRKTEAVPLPPARPGDWQGTGTREIPGVEEWMVQPVLGGEAGPGSRPLPQALFHQISPRNHKCNDDIIDIRMALVED